MAESFSARASAHIRTQTAQSAWKPFRDDLPSSPPRRGPPHVPAPNTNPRFLPHDHHVHAVKVRFHAGQGFSPGADWHRGPGSSAAPRSRSARPGNAVAMGLSAPRGCAAQTQSPPRSTLPRRGALVRIFSARRSSSHSICTPEASRMRRTAAETSGPMPSPGNSVILCLIRASILL